MLAPVVQAVPAEDQKPFRVMVLGDSLSAAYGISPKQGWVTLLAERLRQEAYSAEVVNAAISGNTTAAGRSRLAGALAEHQPNLVLLELGGNDGLQVLPLQAMRKNLETMIDEIRESGADVVLLGIRIPPNYGQRYTHAFERVFKEVAEEKKTPFLPFLLEGVVEHSGWMQDDGIHPTAAAQPAILENVWPVLKPLLPAGKKRE
ncbi:arylesterase [gamma proteobacterium HdN1]|nr:arylesterase [gamma proteobacterium HdN1]